MPRTTADLVKAILLDDYGPRLDETLPSLTGFIETASSMVDDLVTCAADIPLVLSDAKLELIERWLAAHCYKQSDKDLTSKSTEGASGSFAGRTGMRLESTLYGQTAMTLDTSGCLVSISSGETAENVAGGFWIGTHESAQRTYDERNR